MTVLEQLYTIPKQAAEPRAGGREDGFFDNMVVREDKFPLRGCEMV